jgi:WD40 repeat protein
MDGFKLVTQEETGLNPLGLCALSPNPKNEYLVFPSFKLGTIQVVNLRNVNQQRSIAPATINAHESDVVKLAIDNQGSKIATGSTKVCLILK